jgi:hypothetical protein
MPALYPASHLWPSLAEFEVQIHKLGLNEQTCATSEELKHWCGLNKNNCYIQEWLLEHWGMSVEPHFTRETKWNDAIDQYHQKIE